MGKNLIYVDILTPKQALFFGELIKALKRMNYDVLATTRKYRETNQLLELKKIEAFSVGEHGGWTLEGKLKASLERILKLTEILSREKPEVSISYSSPEAARACFGLGVPHISVNDSPHAEAVARLSIPLSKKLLFPWVIPAAVWLRLGATRNMMVKYEALDPVVWLRGFKADVKVLDELNVSKEDMLVVIRQEETYAAYLRNELHGKTMITNIVENLLRQLDETVKFIVLPRYDDQSAFLKRKFGEAIIVPERVVDAPSLLSYTSVFIGGGGTMTAEAALLGVPAFSCFPGKPTCIEKFLISKGLVARILNPKDLAVEAAKTIRSLDEYKRLQALKAERLMARMENPVDVMVKVISSFLS